MTLAPVRWHPAKASNFERRRAGRVPIAEVDHRMVGWLLGTRRYFTVSSERPVSTHFGIGHEARLADGSVAPLCPECGPITGARGRLVIDQYVDLADTAYGNGNYDSSGGWTAVIRSSGGVVNPNFYTYSIEHEDGATAGRGVVTAHVRGASIALSKLLHGGNLAAIRAAGIQIGGRPWHGAGDGAAMALAIARIPLERERFVSHHRIAGVLKPYCWEPWLNDRGFVLGGTRDGILAALAPTPAPAPRPPVSNVVARWDATRLRSAPRVTATVVRTVSAGDRATRARSVTGGAFVVHRIAGRTWLELTAVNGHKLTRPLYSAAPLWRSL